MADAVYLLDPATSNILWCNRMAYEMLGYGKEEVLNHSVLSLQKDIQGLPSGMKSARSSWTTTPTPLWGATATNKGAKLAWKS